MRKEKALVALLRNLVDLVAAEAARNPEFCVRVEQLLEPIPERSKSKPRKASAKRGEVIPDVYAEWSRRGETDFRFWLREQPIPTIHAVIRTQDLDPMRRTAKWKDPEKLADFVAENLRSRLSRGSSFIRPDVKVPNDG